MLMFKCRKETGSGDGTGFKPFMKAKNPARLLKNPFVPSLNLVQKTLCHHTTL